MNAADRGDRTLEAGDAVLSVEDLHTHFEVGGGMLRSGTTVRAVDGVTFDVQRGEIFGVVGESGSGKTTLGRTILGLVPATSGSVRWKGQQLAGLAEKRFRPLRRELAMIFQDPNASLNPAMTVAQGVGHPLRIHGITLTRRDTRARVAEMLERCGLAPAERVLDVYPEDLSGGQKQRVVIARALITGPELVVADEPVAALDMSVRAKVLELMMDLKDELDLTYLYITHDLSSGRFVCDRISIMYLGQMVEWGPSATIYDEPLHPYTQALLAAIPQPDPSRRGRVRELPHGEIPDALDPPLGCRFHPRCPAAFEPCGWQGRDLVDAMVDRWTGVDDDIMAAELEVLGGDLAAVTIGPDDVRLPGADAGAVRHLLDQVGPMLPTNVTAGVEAVEQDGNDTLVNLRPRLDPVDGEVAGRTVACHLHTGPAALNQA